MEEYASASPSPGFNVQCSFKKHLSPVRNLIYNPRHNQFYSTDDRCLKAWARNKRTGQSEAEHEIIFPNYQSNFVTCMELALDVEFLFVACLDETLKLYNDRLRLKSVMPWSNGIVKQLVYHTQRQELITAGSYGVRVWYCELDYELYKADRNLDPHNMPKLAKDGNVMKWGFGKYQQVRQRLLLVVPGARSVGATLNTISHSGSAWCERVHLHAASDTVFAMFQGGIYGFELTGGTCTHAFPGLHDQCITTMLYLPQHGLMLSASMDPGISVWRVVAGQPPQHFSTIGKASAATVQIACDREGKHMLTASVDGGVTMWVVESLIPVYRLKMAVAAANVGFYGKHCDRCMLSAGSEVKLFSISHLFETWMDCNSPVASLRQLSYGLVLAEFQDSSIRLLDAHSTKADKAVVTTVPQLSTDVIVSVAASLTAGKLFVLMSNGHIHVWEMHLKRPPVFLEAWVHLAKEAPSCIAHLDGAVLPLTVTARLGLPTGPDGVARELLVVGTANGDCMFVDITAGGSSVLRFPAFKSQPLQLVTLDLDRLIMVTSARNTLKVWDLREIKVMHALQASQQVCKLEMLEGRVLVGTVGGSVHVVDAAKGRSSSSSLSNGDHLDAVTGISPSVYLQHFVTSSRDSHVKVYDRDKGLKASLYMGGPVLASCYLNDEGDILAGLGHRLVLVRASKYLSAGGSPHAMYDALRGHGHAPKALRRAMACPLQALSQQPPPLDRYIHTEAAPEPDRPGAAGAKTHTRMLPIAHKNRALATDGGSPRLLPQESPRRKARMEGEAAAAAAAAAAAVLQPEPTDRSNLSRQPLLPPLPLGPRVTGRDAPTPTSDAPDARGSDLSRGPDIPGLERHGSRWRPAAAGAAVDAEVAKGRRHRGEHDGCSPTEPGPVWLGEGHKITKLLSVSFCDDQVVRTRREHKSVQFHAGHWANMTAEEQQLAQDAEGSLPPDQQRTTGTSGSTRSNTNTTSGRGSGSGTVSGQRSGTGSPSPTQPNPTSGSGSRTGSTPPSVLGSSFTSTTAALAAVAIAKLKAGKGQAPPAGAARVNPHPEQGASGRASGSQRSNVEPGRESVYMVSSNPLLPRDGARSSSASQASTSRGGDMGRPHQDGTPADDIEDDGTHGDRGDGLGGDVAEGAAPEGEQSSATFELLAAGALPTTPPIGGVAQLEAQRLARQREQEAKRKELHAQRQIVLQLELREQQQLVQLGEAPGGEWQRRSTGWAVEAGLWGGANAAAASANAHYSFDLGREQHRKLNGLPPSSSVSTKSGAGGLTAALSPKTTTDTASSGVTLPSGAGTTLSKHPLGVPTLDQSGGGEADSSADGPDDGRHSDPDGHSSDAGGRVRPRTPTHAEGLSGLFKNALSLISSATAFLDGKVPGQLAKDMEAAAAAALKRKKRRKKKRKKVKKDPGGLKALAALDPAMALDRGTKVSAIRVELKDFIKHRSVHKSCAITFLPPKGSGRLSPRPSSAHTIPDTPSFTQVFSSLRGDHASKLQDSRGLGTARPPPLAAATATGTTPANTSGPGSRPFSTSHTTTSLAQQASTGQPVDPPTFRLHRGQQRRPQPPAPDRPQRWMPR
ncbi:MAG: hypothetical protein WDW38_006784 [Sanguina aurantia]